jgi:hypothetical protein
LSPIGASKMGWLAKGCNTMDHDKLIAELHALRKRVAELAKEQAGRELDARVLRLTIETELRTKGRSQTAAESEAKGDERYLAHARESIQLGFDRAVLEARAEAARLNLELQIALVRRESVAV